MFTQIGHLKISVFHLHRPVGMFGVRCTPKLGPLEASSLFLVYSVVKPEYSRHVTFVLRTASFYLLVYLSGLEVEWTRSERRDVWVLSKSIEFFIWFFKLYANVRYERYVCTACELCTADNMLKQSYFEKIWINHVYLTFAILQCHFSRLWYFHLIFIQKRFFFLLLRFCNIKRFYYQI